MTSGTREKTKTDNPTANQSESHTFYPMSEYSLCDLDVVNFLESLNTPAPTQRVTDCVNPKELDHNGDASSNPFRSPQMKQTLRKDVHDKTPEKQSAIIKDLWSTLATVKESQKPDAPKDLWQPLSTAKDTPKVDVPKTSNETVNLKAKLLVAQHSKEEPKTKNEDSGKNIWQTFTETKDNQAKVVVVPTDSCQMTTEFYQREKDNNQPVDSLYSVIHPNGQKAPAKEIKKPKTKTVAEKKEICPPSNRKEKSRDNLNQTDIETGRVDKRRDVLPYRSLRKNRM